MEGDFFECNFVRWKAASSAYRQREPLLVASFYSAVGGAQTLLGTESDPMLARSTSYLLHPYPKRSLDQ